MISREIRLASRPTGMPTPDNFDLTQVDLPDPQPGEVLVRNLYMSVDPYMRGRMNDAPSYIEPFVIGQALSGDAVGQVVASDSADLREGDIVRHGLGWRDLAVVPAAAATGVSADVHLSYHLGVLGMPGFTAYIGLTEIAKLRGADVVFVSAAAGAVGSAAGQFARVLGAERVVGSAGSDEKAAVVTSRLNFDASFNYRSGNIEQQLRESAPDGIDVYFDNVGSTHLEAAIASLRTYGRIAACGSISGYNSAEPEPAPRNLNLIVAKRLSMQGFIVSDHSTKFTEFYSTARNWLESGQVTASETVTQGLENAPRAFIEMFHGANVGKAIVHIAQV